MKQEYFIKEHEKNEKLWLQADKKRAHIANLRLVAAVVVLCGLAMCWKSNVAVGIVLGIVGCVSFFVLVSLDSKVSDEAQLLNAKKTVLKRYIERFDDEWYDFSDTGDEYLDEKFTNGVDLDIFGERSVFQYINIAHTMQGRDALAAALKGKYIAEVHFRQEAVAELSHKIDSAIALETMAQKTLGDKALNRECVERFMKSITGGKKEPIWKNILSFGLPIATLAALVAGIVGAISFKPLVLLIAVQLFLSMYTNGEIKANLDMLYEMYRPLEAYDQLAKVLLNEQYTAPYLKTQVAKLANDGGAEKGLRSLSRIAGMLKVQNSMLYLPLCGILMWNYHSLRMFNNWCLKYGHEAGKWLEAIGEFEALYSLAMIGYVKDTHCLPDIITDDITPQLEMKNALHPLIAQKRAVGNDFAICGGLAVITGSNMSGKTTFLRTIGVNLTLAYAGGLVCAEQFKASVMKLMTSMRISDDVSRGISTFYGELLRIKGMVEYSKSQKPLLALIDEIFKGTNSADRIIGAEATLKTLNKPWVLALVSTHDFELCDLANDEQVNGVNYHFEEYYDNGRLKFDYTIKPNRCHTSNAQALMKMVGILPEQQ